MKKLLFAIAGAASFAALAADPTTGRTGDISWVGFENYTVDQTVVGYGDDGNSGGTLWSYTGEQGGDASLVKTYGGDNATAPTGISFPAPFEGAGDNYLALDTNGAELQRAIPAAGQAIAADGTYIDTLVQFTPSESAPTETDLNGAKLAIWLGVDSENNTTNLMVQGAYYTQENAADPTTFNFAGTKAYKLSGTYQPGTWYRLTVKAYSSLINGFTGQYLPGFVIAVDGQTLASDESATDANAYSFLTSPMDMGMDELVTPVTGDNKSLLDNNQFIPSLSVTSMENAPTLTSVGFKGTGALDDFVVTTAAPDFTPAVIEFTLTLTKDENVAGAVVTTNGAAVVFDNGTAQIPEGTAVSIAEPTYATGYQLAGVTTNTVAVAEPSWPLTFTMDGAMTVAITSEAVPVVEDWVDNPVTDITAGNTAVQAYPGLANSALAGADAQKLTTWAKAKNIAYNDIKNDTTGTYVDAYLLNCAVAEVEAEKAAFVANITIAADGTPVVTAPEGKSYNGTLQLKGKVNLSDAAWTNVEAASSTYKFYMYELSL